MQRLLTIIERLLALGLVVLLLRSAFSHLANPYYFLSSIHAYQLIGKTLGEYLAMVVPFFQIILALLLVIRWSPGLIYIMTAFLFAVFIAAQASVLTRGLEISCGCFGAADSVHVGAGTLSVAIGGCIVCIAGGLIVWKLNRMKPIALEAIA